MKDTYDLERSVHLLRSINFNVVRASVDERAMLEQALVGAENSLKRRTKMLSSFGKLYDATVVIGRRTETTSNKWLLAVAERIDAVFGGLERRDE